MSRMIKKSGGVKKHSYQLSDLDIIVDFYERGGELLTDSLTIARIFSKSHQHVLKKIEDIKCSQGFSEPNFRRGLYKDAQGQSRSIVELTKNGMMFVVTSLTGEKANAVREAFINEFERRAEIIRQQKEENTELRRKFNDLFTLVMNEAERIRQQDQENTELQRKFDDLYTLVMGVLEHNQDQLPPEMNAEIQELKPRMENVEQKNGEVRDNTEEIEGQAWRLDHHRRDPSKKHKKIHLDVITGPYGCKCPCCGEVVIAHLVSRVLEPVEYAFTSECNFDHWYHCSRNGLEEVWPICKHCNQERETGEIPPEKMRHRFMTYIGHLQEHRRRKGLDQNPTRRPLLPMNKARKREKDNE